VEGELTHAMMTGSVKALDLLRDGRAYLHTPILDAALGRPGEFKLRARAHLIEDERLREAVRDAVEKRGGWRPPENWHFFRIEVESAAFHDYDPDEDVHHIKRWTPERGYEAASRTITT
jgi:hypothetical protein